MGHFEEIDSALADNQYAALSRSQAEALVDAVALTMVIEGEVPEREETESARIFLALDDLTNFRVDDYVEEALEKARDVAGEPERIEAFCRDVAQRLDDPTLQDEAYYLAGRMAAIDIDVVREETEVLSTFVEVFEIPRGRLKKLTQRLRHKV